MDEADQPVVDDLGAEDLGRIGWSGSPTHLRDVARQLERVASGEIEYLVVRVNGEPVAKAGVDFAAEPGAATVWQVATHSEYEGSGYATLLMAAAEDRARARGIARIRLGVEVENLRAQALYDHLGFVAIGESVDEWEAEAADGSPCLHHAICIQMLKELR